MIYTVSYTDLFFLLLLYYFFDNVTRLIRIITIIHTPHIGSHATFRRAVKRSYQQIRFGSKPQLGYRYSSKLGLGVLGFSKRIYIEIGRRISFVVLVDFGI